MAKGQIAKEQVSAKIAEAFGKDFVGIVDKKLYVWGMENGERVQICLSMTCPKTPIEGGAAPVTNTTATGNFDWSGTAAPAPQTPVEISKEDDEQVSELMRRLGIEE
ncbi:MAG: hypothetical protein NC218_11720 [Acetobacter sp.]|nr:hypothetical protein [Acetobacter sp.]